MSQSPNFLQQAMAHHTAGRLSHAAAMYRALVQRAPQNADAWHLLGLALHQQGHHAAALPHLQRALALQPHAAPFHNSHGAVLRKLGRGEEAVAAFGEAVRLAPLLSDAWLNCFQAWMGLERADEAERMLDVWVERSGGAVAALQNRAAHRYASGDVRGALADHERVARQEAGGGQTLCTVGLLAHELGDDARALKAFAEAGRAPEDRAVLASSTTCSKLDHDIEQLAWLQQQGVRTESFGAALAAFRAVRTELAARTPAPQGAIELSADQRERLGPWYLKADHIAASPALAEGALSPAWDAEAVEARYRSQQPGVTWIDGLLTPAALQALRRFCLESRVWTEYRYKGGYVGASLVDGFVSPLLLQIARELRARLPGLLGAHPLRQMWAYKYDQQMTGIGVHADSAAVNVNFWITPDEANLHPAGGGLRVWRAGAPLEWDFDAFNRQPERLRAWLAEVGAEEVVVPHRANRAVLFNSNMVHRTDDLHFAPGYENRRVNITMLFGARGG